MRRIQFGGFEHQQREIYAEHVHVTEPGVITYFGNGETVMAVVKAAKPWVEVIGEDGLNEFGEEFNYAGYFLPGELGDGQEPSDPNEGADRIDGLDDSEMGTIDADHAA